MTEFAQKVKDVATAYRALLLAIGITLSSAIGGAFGAIEYLDSRYVLASDARVLQKSIITNRLYQLNSTVRQLRRDKSRLENKDSLTTDERNYLESIKDDLNLQQLLRDNTQKEILDMK